MHPHRKPNRLIGYDYSRDALYFTTSCVLHNACVFGEVSGGEMQLNAYGCIAEKQWHWLEEQYPYVTLHDFVVMPNHIHAVIEINQEDMASGIKIKSLSGLMGVYKTTTSKQIRLAGLPDFAWKRSFHDHIIRHDKAYNQIIQYIRNNPAKWQEDTFHPKS